MASIEGQAGDGKFYTLPLNADGTAVAVEAGSALLVTGSATAAKQDTQQTTLDAISAAQTSGAQKVKTSLPTGTHIGGNINPNASSVQFASQVTTIGLAVFGALLANTAPVYIARAAGVTTATGIELAPGDSITLPCANTNEYWAISAASQNVRALAL